ncbi:MAG: hypothetical protein NTU88_15085 [Armatimonadetes bacterium]|nr:hypothetical protein [Armatimonadota bacterium]
MNEDSTERSSEQEAESEQERKRREEAAAEAGRKGGAAAMAAAMPHMREEVAAALWTRDLVRWGPIWAGLLLALGVQVVLGAVSLAVALSIFSPTEADYAQKVANFASILSVISGLIALFLGGFVAGRMASVLGLRNGIVQGSVVWALALLIGVVLSALGIAGLLNAINVAPYLRGMMLTSPEQQMLIRNAVSGTWWFVVGSLLAWIAAAVGGIRGAAAHAEEMEEGHP